MHISHWDVVVMVFQANARVITVVVAVGALVAWTCC